MWVWLQFCHVSLGFLEGRNFRGGEFLRQYLQKRSLFSSIAFHSYHFAKYCISIGSKVMFIVFVKNWIYWCLVFAKFQKELGSPNFLNCGLFNKHSTYIASFSWKFALYIKGKKSHKKPFRFEKNVEPWRLIFYPISGNKIKTFWDLLRKWHSISVQKCIKNQE